MLNVLCVIISMLFKLKNGFFARYGGRSSAVERRPVEADVTGSIPVGHPKTIGLQTL